MSALEQMHEDHKARRARLWKGKEPSAKPGAKTIDVSDRGNRVPQLLPRLPMVRVSDMLPVSGNQPERDRTVAIRIIRACCAEHDISVADLRSKSRRREIVLARHAAMYRLRYQTTLSLVSIGNLLGRDHTSVLHGISAHTNRTARKPKSSKQESSPHLHIQPLKSAANSAIKKTAQ